MSSRLVFCFLNILQLFNFVITKEDYCDASLCPSGVKHIGCDANKSPGAQCDKSAKILGMTDKYRNTIVQKHNAMRNQVAKGSFNGFPVAARMLTMQWDKELEELSEYNVLRCMLKNSECTNTSVYYSVGQNLAYNKFHGKQNPRIIIKGQMFMWIDEYRYTSIESIISGSGAGQQEIGHFLQVIVDKSDRIGCAVLLQTKDSWNYQYMACKYAVAQDACDTGIYKFGTTPGDACETGLNPTYTCLCSTDEKSYYGPPIQPDQATDSDGLETTQDGKVPAESGDGSDGRNSEGDGGNGGGGNGGGGNGGGGNGGGGNGGGGNGGGGNGGDSDESDDDFDIFKNLTEWVKDLNSSNGFNLSFTDEHGQSFTNNSFSVDVKGKNKTRRSGRRRIKKRSKKRTKMHSKKMTKTRSKKRTKTRSKKRTKRMRMRTKVRSEVQHRWG